MRIGIDAMGGDYAPLEAIKGAVLAKAEFPSVELVMFGVQSRNHLKNRGSRWFNLRTRELSAKA